MAKGGINAGCKLFSGSFNISKDGGVSRVELDRPGFSYTVDTQLTLVLTDSLGNEITTISEGNPGIVTVTSSDAEPRM